MKLLRLPDDATRPLDFYLAMEEWAADSLVPGESCFFTWRVAPTVIIGRHQRLHDEVDVRFCADNGIDIVRRRSGGGAVLADMGNLMFSHIAWGDDTQAMFARFTSSMAAMLRSLGIDAKVSGRNDITIGGAKVSGNSFYQRRGRGIAHGTLLHTFNPAMMAGALKPPALKLSAHGVASVHSRVTCVSHHSDIGIDDLRSRAEVALTDNITTLTDADCADICRRALPYREPQWLTGADCKQPRHARNVRARLNGVGTLSVGYDLNRGRLCNVTLQGDWFELRPGLDVLLEGAPATAQALTKLLGNNHASTYIRNLNDIDLINLILQ